MKDRSEPTFFVLVRKEGSREDERVDARTIIKSFSYTEDESKTDLCKLTVLNQHLKNFDDPLWKPGNLLTVSWGYPGNMSPPREVRITKVAGSSELSIEAQGKEADMAKVTRSRTFRNKTRAQVVAEIARENGFAESALWLQESEVAFESLAQTRETDYQFLRRLAELEGFEFFADVDGLHFHERQVGQQPRKQYRWFLPAREGVVGNVGDVIEWALDSDIFGKPADKAGKVTIKGRDPASKKDVEACGCDANTPRDTLAPELAIPDLQTGQSIWEPETAREDTRPTTAPTAGIRKALTNEANAVYRKSQQATVLLTLKIVGDPEVTAKTVIEISGISKRLSGKYYVKSATHEVSSGYVTTLKLTSDGVNAALGEQSKARPQSKAQPNVKSCAEICKELAPVERAAPGEVTPPDGGWPDDLLTGQSEWTYQPAGSGTAVAANKTTTGSNTPKGIR